MKQSGKRYERVDQNDDGRVTREEMREVMRARHEERGGHGGWRHRHGGGKARGHGRRFFGEFDLNEDGEITKAEFDSRLTKYFALADRDDDGAVSAREMERARPIFAAMRAAGRGGKHRWYRHSAHHGERGVESRNGDNSPDPRFNGPDAPAE
ncbi:MAG: EF-hand domain-containing protein [Pseudomonadota bacterium]